jgi:hypothetical protein
VLSPTRYGQAGHGAGVVVVMGTVVVGGDSGVGVTPCGGNVVVVVVVVVGTVVVVVVVMLLT